MTFKEWYRAYNPELDMDCDINLDELLSCWYAAYEDGYERAERIMPFSIWLRWDKTLIGI